MGKEDIVTNAFFEDNRRFADVVNAGVFHGKKILQADKLESEKSSTSTLVGNSSKPAEYPLCYARSCHGI